MCAAFAMCRVGMGRVGYRPSCLCTEFAMCRVNQTPCDLISAEFYDEDRETDKVGNLVISFHIIP